MGRLCADEYPCSEVQDEQEMAQEDLMMAVATEAAKLIVGKESSSVYILERICGMGWKMSSPTHLVYNDMEE